MVWWNRAQAYSQFASLLLQARVGSSYIEGDGHGALIFQISLDCCLWCTGRSPNGRSWGKISSNSSRTARIYNASALSHFGSTVVMDSSDVSIPSNSSLTNRIIPGKLAPLDSFWPSYWSMLHWFCWRDGLGCLLMGLGEWQWYPIFAFLHHHYGLSILEYTWVYPPHLSVN